MREIQNYSLFATFYTLLYFLSKFKNRNNFPEIQNFGRVFN